jgi:hypothetical protein
MHPFGRIGPFHHYSIPAHKPTDQIEVSLASLPALISIALEFGPNFKRSKEQCRVENEKAKGQLTRTRISIGRFGRTPLGGRQLSTVHLDDPDRDAVGCTEEVVPFGLQNQNEHSRRG